MLQITKQQAKVLKVASRDEARPVLTAVEVKLTGKSADKRLSVTGTNSYILLNVKSRPAVDQAEFEERLVAPSEINRALALAKIDKADMVDLPDVDEADREIEGHYPAWEKLVPKGRAAAKSLVNRKLLIDLLQAMDCMTIELDIAKTDTSLGDARLQPVLVTGTGDDAQEYNGLIMPLRS